MVSFSFAESERGPGQSGGYGVQRGAGGSSSSVPARISPIAAWALLEKCGDALLLSAPDGTLRYTNRAAHKLFKHEFKEGADALAGRNWLAWVYPSDQAALNAAFEKLRRQPGGHTMLDVRLRLESGEWRCCEITLTNLLDDQPKAWLLQVRDITARRENEDALRHTATHFAEAQHLAALGRWEWDLETNCIQWSEELFHIFGLRPGETELTYAVVEACIHSEDRDGVRLATERAARDRKLLDHSFRIVRPSGAVRTIHMRARPIAGIASRITHMIGIAQDVTDSLQFEQDLRISEARFRRIADSNIIGIMSWDDRGRITEANDAFLRIAGYTRSDLWEGRLHPDELTPSEYREADAIALQELADRGCCTPYEKEYVRKDGTRVPVLLGAAYLEPGTGRDMGICFVLDISSPQAASAALREREALYRKIVEEASPDAVFLLSQGCIIFANAAGARFLGARSAQDVIGRLMADLFLPVEASLQELAIMGGGLRSEIDLMILGRVRRCEMRLQSLGENEAAVFIRDIT